MLQYTNAGHNYPLFKRKGQPWEELIDVVERTKNQSGEEALEEVLADVNEYAAGVPQFDDITMINMTIKE